MPVIVSREVAQECHSEGSNERNLWLRILRFEVWTRSLAPQPHFTHLFFFTNLGRVLTSWITHLLSRQPRFRSLNDTHPRFVTSIFAKHLTSVDPFSLHSFPLCASRWSFRTSYVQKNTVCFSMITHDTCFVEASLPCIDNQKRTHFRHQHG